MKLSRSELDFSSLIRRLGRHERKTAVPLSGWTLGGDIQLEWQLADLGGTNMKTWTKPEVREQEVGLEVTSYLPAEIDII